MIDLATVERVASGLRAMKIKPDAFVFVDGLADLTWDESTACGIPVFHGAGFLPPHYGSDPLVCPFIPVWENEQRLSLIESRRFVSGYCSWSSDFDWLDPSDRDSAFRND